MQDIHQLFSFLLNTLACVQKLIEGRSGDGTTLVSSNEDNSIRTFILYAPCSLCLSGFALLRSLTSHLQASRPSLPFILLPTEASNALHDSHPSHPSQRANRLSPFHPLRTSNLFCLSSPNAPADPPPIDPIAQQLPFPFSNPSHLPPHPRPNRKIHSPSFPPFLLTKSFPRRPQPRHIHLRSFAKWRGARPFIENVVFPACKSCR